MARFTATIISTDEALEPGILLLGMAAVDIMAVVDITAEGGTEVIASLNFSQVFNRPCLRTRCNVMPGRPAHAHGRAVEPCSDVFNCITVKDPIGFL
jgi:hypothetical protein